MWTAGAPFKDRSTKTSYDQLRLYKKCTVMRDLEGAPAVHFNLPLLSFYFCTTF